MNVCPRCGKESVTAEWIATCCPQQPIEIQEAIFASMLCVPHALTYFGIDVAHRSMPLAPPVPLAPNDGTLDYGGRI